MLDVSPIIFTLFTADLELWCKFSKIYSYDDDTTSSCKGKYWEEIIKNLKRDAEAILSYMASNGLVANASKETNRNHTTSLKKVFPLIKLSSTKTASCKPTYIVGCRGALQLRGSLPGIHSRV